MDPGGVTMRGNRFTQFKAVVFGLAVGISIIGTGTGTAHASAGSRTLNAFAAQARAAGLTAAEAKGLQARVDDYLQKVGGVQVAANEIEYGIGATLTLTLPGEQRARSLSDPDMTDCPYYHFCGYKFNFGVGDRITAYYCNTRVYIPWTTNGSWFNNQTPQTWTQLQNYNGGVVTWSIAPQKWYDYPWTPVYWVDPC